MEEIGSAPPSELLMLMLMPLMAAIILAGLLIFFFLRRQRKTAEPPSPVVLTNSGLTARPAAPEPPPPPSAESSILNVLSQKVDMEVLTMETRQPAAKLDLSGRLNSYPPETAPPDEPVELLRLLRQPQTGQLVVEAAGHRYTKLADVRDKQVGQDILELVAHLLAFTNGMIATESGVKSVYLPRVKQTPLPLAAPSRPAQVITPSRSTAPPVSRPASVEPAVPPPPPEVEAAFLASLRSQPPQPEPKPPRSGGLFGGRSKPKNEPAPLMAFNLADEINKIVQARLLASPLAAATQLEILSDASGGIKIDVNGRVYASPDDIPDPEVKALIKESIKQWERS